MNAVAQCLRAVEESSTSSDLHLLGGKAYLASGKPVPGVRRKTAERAFSELVDCSSNTEQLQELDDVVSHAGVKYRAVIRPTARQAVMRRLPSPQTEG